MESHKKKSILILHPTIDIVGPRSIRAIHIAEHLAKEYQIYILSFNTSSTLVKIPDVNIVRLVPSFFIGLFYQFSALKKKNKRPSSFIKNLLKKRAKKIFFPDPWISEHNRVIAYFKKNSIANIDFIIASLGPYSNVKLASRIKNSLFNNAKLILDIGDPLVNNIENIKEDKKYISYEKNALQTAEHIIATNINTKEDFIRRYNINKDKISVISQGVSKVFIDKIISYKKERTSRIKLFYAGAFYKSFRDPTHFIDAIKTINNENIVVDIFDSLNYIARETRQISIYPKSSQEELIPFYQEADILLFFDNAEGIQTPGKIYELLAMKKPILFIYSNVHSELKNELIQLDHIVFCKDSVNEIKMGITIAIEKNINLTTKSDQYYWKERAEMFKKILKNES